MKNGTWRNILGFLAGSAVVVVLGAALTVAMPALTRQSGRAPEAFLGLFLLVAIPVVFFLGGVASGFVADTRVRLPWLQSIFNPPGLYLALWIAILSATNIDNRTYPGLLLGYLISAALIFLLSTAGFLLAAWWKINFRSPDRTDVDQAA